MTNAKYPSVRILVLITTEKSAKLASEMFASEKIPIQHSVIAEGTATSEIMDMLGLGTSEKRLLISILPRQRADLMLRRLHLELSMHTVNSGIAFTIPVNGANSLLLKMITSGYQETESTVGKEEEKMSENKFVLIAAIVNRGFSGEVMVAAREAGANGGTVVHSRQLAGEESDSYWGINVQEEKEILLIISDTENKVNLMKTISEKYGVHSDAKGIVISMPIDSVMGI